MEQSSLSYSSTTSTAGTAGRGVGKTGKPGVLSEPAMGVRQWHMKQRGARMELKADARMTGTPAAEHEPLADSNHMLLT
jgi:hypothetical protein